MNVFWWRGWPNGFYFEFPGYLSGILLVLVYTLLFFWFLWQHRREFAALTASPLILTGVSLALLLPASSFLVLYRTVPDILLSSSSGVLFAPVELPVLMYLLVGAVAIWLGPGPGVVVGLIGGLFQNFYITVPLTDAFIPAFWAAALGMMAHQPYRGSFFDFMRRPILAIPLATICAVLLLGINRLAEMLLPGGMQAFDAMVTVLTRQWGLWLACSVILTVIFEGLFLIPSWHPRQRSDVAPNYTRSLRDRLMIVIIPLVLLSIVLSVLAASTQAVRLARDQAQDEMRRSANNAGDGIIHFFYTGPNLLATFATDPALLSPETRAHVMETDRQVVPFFQQLLFTDAQGQVVESVPAGLGNEALTPEEQQVLRQALVLEMSQYTHLTLLKEDEAYLTFVQPVFSAEGGSVEGVLLGRTRLDIHPDIQRAREALQLAQGLGFIVDNRGLIIAHPDSSFILRPWTVNQQGRAALEQMEPGSEDDESFYEEDDMNGKVLTYIRKIGGTPCFVVLQLPYAFVLETAMAIAGPLLLVQLLIGAVLLFALPLLSARITKPLNTLALASHRIAQGNLAMPVSISGEDEVAQLGRAFEQMRVGLRARLDDLSLLLRVSQAVSATLDLDQGVPPILRGAQEETGATVAHFVLLGVGDRVQRTFSVGGEDPSFAAVDRAFATALQRRRDPLVVQDLQRSGSSLPQTQLRSVAALPVRTKDRAVAVLWVGSEQVDAFDEARVNFLNTLASQAAVLVENVRLFQSAEGGRRRLAAILASTNDAILVTDHEGKLLLINPAVQRVLGLDEGAYGKPVEELNLPAPLNEVLSRSEAEPRTPSSVEVPVSGRRTFYASIAPIMTAEGHIMGRVAVMRDITHFKELDEMKSDFVATVSHDLRAPLTFMRGYATMLTMVGTLNEKQQEYLDHILEGIEQMSALIGDLLNLRRIEAGVGIKQEPCRLGLVLVEAVDTMRARASAKGITLGLDPAEGAPVIIGDRTLLRQAIGNLVDNAIKYTAAGGQVRVGLEVDGLEAIVHVSDTGMGIAPEDQVRLFEKFYRVKRRETSDIPGTGLGLALVKSIVEHHQGRVWAESELNKGTTFYVALPLARESN